MRKLIYAINQTLDGCYEHTQVPPPNAELFEYYVDLVRNAGAFVYGRKTYQLMVPYWPDVLNDESSTKDDIEFAEAFCAVDKMVVFSRSLDKAEGKNTEIIRNNIEEEVFKLKQQEGKYILTGGIDIPSQLMQLGLVDEFLIVVNPVIAGEGKRLMECVAPPRRAQLKLVETKVFESGCIFLRYVKG